MGLERSVLMWGGEDEREREQKKGSSVRSTDRGAGSCCQGLFYHVHSRDFNFRF